MFVNRREPAGQWPWTDSTDSEQTGAVKTQHKSVCAGGGAQVEVWEVLVKTTVCTVHTKDGDNIMVFQKLYMYYLVWSTNTQESVFVKDLVRIRYKLNCKLGPLLYSMRADNRLFSYVFNSGRCYQPWIVTTAVLHVGKISWNQEAFLSSLHKITVITFKRTTSRWHRNILQKNLFSGRESL